MRFTKAQKRTIGVYHPDERTHNILTYVTVEQYATIVCSNVFTCGPKQKPERCDADLLDFADRTGLKSEAGLLRTAPMWQRTTHLDLRNFEVQSLTTEEVVDMRAISGG